MTNNLKQRILKSKLALNTLLTAFWIISYVLNPIAINLAYSASAWTFLLVITSYLVVNSLDVLSALNLSAVSTGAERINLRPIVARAKKRVVILVVLWAIFFGVTVASMVIFNYKAYRDQFGEPVLTEFSQDVQLVDLAQVPIVDKELAKTLADRKLGEDPGLGSQVFVGEPVIQQINGDLVWAVPLHHSGFFMWLNNMSGARGYIKVSATDLQDIELVNTPIKYQPNSYFFDDIDRYVRFLGGKIFNGLTDYSFEISDDGDAYWIITTYENKWLFSLPEATGVITLNASTGDIEQYGMDDIPSWVDRVQPENYIVNQIDNQGEYVHGIFNFSNKDKFMTSRQTAIVYLEGNCFLFTGLTSVGADESAIGFLMVDMVTKESKLYRISGATETAAMLSAQGAVQQFGYFATSPIIINHKGVPTYFITLKDNSGLIKQYAFVSVENVTIVGTGDTITEALRDYNSDLGATNTFETEEGSLITLRSTVLRIASEAGDFGQIYNFILEDNEQKIFYALQDITPELSLTQTGDEVEISFYESTEGYIRVVSFDNTAFDQL